MTTDTPILTERPKLKILRKPEVLDRVGCSDQHLLNMEACELFPRRIQLGYRSVGWLEHEVDQWIESKMRQRDDAVKAEEQRVSRMPPAVRHRYRQERETDTA